jgi:hypothetical protein
LRPGCRFGASQGFAEVCDPQQDFYNRRLYGRIHVGGCGFRILLGRLGRRQLRERELHGLLQQQQQQQRGCGDRGREGQRVVRVW